MHKFYTISVLIIKFFSYYILSQNFLLNSINGDKQKMKKVNPKIVALAIMILSFVAVGGIAAKTAIAPSGVGQGDTGSGGAG